MGQFPVPSVTVEVYYKPDFPFDDGVPYASGLTDSAGKFCFAHPGIVVADAVVIKDYDWCHISAPPIVRRDVAIGTCDVLPFFSSCDGGANPGWHGSYTVDTPSLCTGCCWPHCTPKLLRITPLDGITRNFNWTYGPYVSPSGLVDVLYQDSHWAAWTTNGAGTSVGTCGGKPYYITPYVTYHMKCCRDVYGNAIWLMGRQVWTISESAGQVNTACDDLYGPCWENQPECRNVCSVVCDMCKWKTFTIPCCTWNFVGYQRIGTPFYQEVVPLSLVSCCPFTGSATFGGPLPETVTITEPP